MRLYSALSAESRDEMVSAYLSGESAIVAAGRLDCPYWTCTNELRRRGIALRGPQRKYPVNEDFFDIIDTEEKSYWLGFITADGSVGGGALQIRLSTKDRGHLVKFIEVISPGRPIGGTFVGARNGKKYAVSFIKIRSRRLVFALGRLGVYARKFHSVVPCCRQMEEDLVRHYWRGVFDGDGGISRITNRQGAWRIDFVGSEGMVSGFSEWVKSISDNKASVRVMGSIYAICYVGSGTVTRVINELYSNSSVYLDRKFNLFKQVMDDHGQGKNSI